MSFRRKVRSSNCPFDKMFVRQSVRRQNVRSAKCLSAKCLSAKCLSAKCPATSCSRSVVRMRSHRLLRFDDNKSAASCQQAWCKLIACQDFLSTSLQGWTYATIKYYLVSRPFSITIALPARAKRAMFLQLVTPVLLTGNLKHLSKAKHS